MSTAVTIELTCITHKHLYLCVAIPHSITNEDQCQNFLCAMNSENVAEKHGKARGKPYYVI